MGAGAALKRLTLLRPVAICVIAALGMLAGCGEPSSTGTELSARQQAAGFSLDDQFGSTVSLEDLRGRVVVLSFLYTECPDICPIVADHLARVRDDLEDDGSSMDETSILVVSVDPERDSTEAALRYSELWGMAEDWSYLVGDRQALEEVWAAYYISPVTSDSDGHGPEYQGAEGSVDGLVDSTALAYTVDHQAPVYLIDREGRMRVIFTLPIDPRDVARTVRSLLGERAS